jgi:polysaccharide biosynthesis protein VpsM
MVGVLRHRRVRAATPPYHFSNVSTVFYKKPSTSVLGFLQGALTLCLASAITASAAVPDYARQAIADDLAAQVREIVNTSLISRDRKERRITSTVRIAVVAATAYKDDRGEVVGIASQMAIAAAKAAPSYADVIAKAIAFVPSVSRFAGAAGEVRAAAFSGARSRQQRPAEILVRKHRAPKPADSDEIVIGVAPERSVAQEAASQEPVTQPDAQTEPRVAEAPASTEATQTSDTSTAQQAAAAPSGAPEAMPDTSGADQESTGKAASIASKQPLLAVGDSGAIDVSANVGARRDSNIFLSTSNKVAATILSVTPAVTFNYGQNSLAHALLDYEESFNRYSNGAAPNVNLASANGNFGYDDGSLKVAAGGSYQQLYQNNIGILNITGSALIRSNITDFNGLVETHLFSKIGAGLGATYARTEYDAPGLFGNSQVNVPFNLFYAVTPKVDLSAGYTFSQMTPEGNGTIAKGGYYNVGARGNFTSKLTGAFTVGYQTERVPGTPPTHSLGLTSNLSLEITPKTSATLQATRDFETSAQGQVLKNGSYTFGLASDITNRWEVSTGVTYRTLDYGQELYPFESALVAQNRMDKFWEGNFQLSYIFTNWFTTSVSYVIRDDHSTLPGVEFGDNVFSLNLKFVY